MKNWSRGYGTNSRLPTAGATTKPLLEGHELTVDHTTIQAGAFANGDRTLVSVVVIAIAAFEIWFFFFSASPIDHRSGRAAASATERVATSPHAGRSSDRV